MDEVIVTCDICITSSRYKKNTGDHNWLHLHSNTGQEIDVCPRCQNIVTVMCHYGVLEACTPKSGPKGIEHVVIEHVVIGCS